MAEDVFLAFIKPATACTVTRLQSEQGHDFPVEPPFSVKAGLEYAVTVRNGVAVICNADEHPGFVALQEKRRQEESINLPEGLGGVFVAGGGYIKSKPAHP